MIIFSVASLIDLDDIYDFHLARNPRYAAELSKKLRNAARSLSDYPDRGTVVATAPFPLRRLMESGDAILYEATENSVTITRVLHGSRDIAAIVSDLT